MSRLSNSAAFATINVEQLKREFVEVKAIKDSKVHVEKFMDLAQGFMQLKG